MKIKSLIRLFTLGCFVLYSVSCEKNKEEQNSGSKPDIPSQEDIYKKNKEELIKLLKQEKVPGAQITHSKNGVVNTYYLGERIYDTNQIVSSSTIFQAASMTKAVAAYTAMRLLDKGVFELDKPLSEYWDNPRLNKEYPYIGEITARMTLNCTSGLEDWGKTPLTPKFRPGTGYLYSGDGFQYLQEVLEFMTGKTYDKIVEEEVLQPFGMTESSMIYQDIKKDFYAIGHDGLEGLVPSPFRQFTKANAAYTLLTKSTDYMRFLQLGIIEGQGLKTETHQQMLTGSSVANPSYAFGIIRSGNGVLLHHTGHNTGQYVNVWIVHPATKECFVMLTNGSNGDNFRKKAVEFLSPKLKYW